MNLSRVTKICSDIMAIPGAILMLTAVGIYISQVTSKQSLIVSTGPYAIWMLAVGFFMLMIALGLDYESRKKSPQK